MKAIAYGKLQPVNIKNINPVAIFYPQGFEAIQRQLNLTTGFKKGKDTELYKKETSLDGNVFAQNHNEP